jgi:hypothetical protein
MGNLGTEEMMVPIFTQMSTEHLAIARMYLGDLEREPNLVIAPDGEPYLYRWFMVPHNKKANVYFHVQVGDDPERPLHDHPWDNFSVILAGGYDEIIQPLPPDGTVRTIRREPGNVIFRTAYCAHRLLLPTGRKYTMSLFSTGPTIKAWGFWYENGWRDAKEVTVLQGNKSVHVKE